MKIKISNKAPNFKLESTSSKVFELEKFKQSQLAKKIEEVFPDAKLLDIEEDIE